ncbi:hypothetical protein Dimus_013616 [Dionaea muscipula]
MLRILHQEDCSSPSKAVSALKHSTLLFFLLCNLLYFVNAYRFIYASRSQEQYEPNSSFEQNLDSFFTSAVNSASGSFFNSFGFGKNGTTTNNEADAAVYGLYQCHGDLKSSDCGSCIRSLEYLTRPSCIRSAAEVVQVTVTLRQRSFEEGTRCWLICNDRGMIEAVSQLKNLCGPVTATAQIFLGTCYVEYWETGYFDLNSGTALLSMNFLLFPLIFFSVSITLSALEP